MSRVGQVFKWNTFVVVVTADPCEDAPLSDAQLECSLAQPTPADQVFTLAVLHDSGAVTWPVQRLEVSLIKWEADGRRVL